MVTFRATVQVSTDAGGGNTRLEVEEYGPPPHRKATVYVPGLDALHDFKPGVSVRVTLEPL